MVPILFNEMNAIVNMFGYVVILFIMALET